MISKQKPKIVRKVWGGKKLEFMKGLKSSAGEEPIGETLEIAQDHLPYLAKFIDTSNELSIQVHPGDEYARVHENSSGKTECWIILESQDEAGIYLGLRPGITRQMLQKALDEKGPIQELLNFYSVKAGDFFFVPAGSIHAIGRDITLAEIQQNSGITYRIWDWDRVDENGISRELHVKKSLDVINFETTKNELAYFLPKQNLFSKNGLAEICGHPQFQLSILNLEKGESYHWEKKSLGRPRSILNLNGKMRINQILIDSYGAVIIEGDELVEISAEESGSALLIY
ncbi:MAG: class I mannose-6-phosphate isomerase [Bacteriovorax sp.]|nr:class I mannose-6-phosphate isomerase [Bacteriovorax sp.]